MNQYPQNQQPYQQPYQQPPPYSPYQQGSSKNKLLLIFGIAGIGCLAVIVLGVLAIFGGLAYIGATTPPTYIIPGREVSKVYRDKMNSLGMLNGSEKIIYMYADGFSLEEGTYMMTDQNIVIYVESWEPPLEVIPLQSIDLIEIDYNTSLFEDSWIYLTTDVGTEDEYEFWFPLSNENGTDRKFVDELVKRSGAEKSILNN